MQTLTVQRGKHISPDTGLSSVFTVQAVDDAGGAVLFDFEPREWLDEWEMLRRANLPPGASYARTLTVCASRFEVRFLTDSAGERFWRFTVFDIPSRSNRNLTLSEGEVSSLAQDVQRLLDF